MTEFIGVVLVGSIIVLSFIGAQVIIPRIKTDPKGGKNSPEFLFLQRMGSMNERVEREVFQGEASCNLDGSRNFFVVDFETTDLSQRWGSVASVAIGLVIDGRLVESAYTLVRPKHRMTEGARSINGLADNVLENGLDGQLVLKGLSCVLPSLPLVTYNTFDLEILRDFAESNKVDLSGLTLHMDTMSLATNILTPGGKWLRLTEACDAVGIEHTDAHNALGDVKATAQLMSKLFEIKEGGDAEIGDKEKWFLPKPFSSQRYQVKRNRAGLYSIVNQDNEQVGEIVKESGSEWVVQSYEDGAKSWFGRLSDATDWVKSVDFQAS